MLKKLYYCKLSAHSKLEERLTALSRLLPVLNFKSRIKQNYKVGIKTHFGDENNDTHIAPELIKVVVNHIKNLHALPFITETSTLYSGSLQNAIQHLILAHKHGFSYGSLGAPIIMADGLMGNTEIKVEIPGIKYKSVNIARDAVLADALVIISHPTGHILTGLGAALKNLGMGLSSRKGKMKQHSSIKPYINSTKCVNCQVCMKWCPVDAIVEKENVAYIIEEKCVGCGECISLCKYDAVRFNWGVQSEDIQKRIAEYALGAVQNKKDKCFYINVMTDMTRECDCMNIKQKPMIDDLGILGGFDPVAIDQATLDLTRKYNKTDLGRLSEPKLDPTVQLDHAEKIGLGSRSYELIEI